MLGDQHIV